MTFSTISHPAHFTSYPPILKPSGFRGRDSFFEMLKSFKIFGAAAFAAASFNQLAELHVKTMAIATMTEFVFNNFAGFRIAYSQADSPCKMNLKKLN